MLLGGACIAYPNPEDLVPGNCGDWRHRVTVPFGLPHQQNAHSMRTLFGPESNYPNLNPWDLAGQYAAYDGKVGIYSGGSPSGEKDLYAHAVCLHDELNRRGVAHEWCVGSGEHNWSHWNRDLTDFLNLVYGPSATCHYVSD